MMPIFSTTESRTTFPSRLVATTAELFISDRTTNLLVLSNTLLRHD
ncbi:MAG: hypothetical protein V7L00_24490 [Nostoc sp.]